ncbi:MAG: polysaccharide biosynthesis tyrosine autokinase [Chloroflexi bacterium]|nr:polysaccharide biosynthesis tyrosine autokinase [Chloroflexota bacterium]
MLPLLAGIAAFLYSRNQPLVYEASATLLVQQSRGSTPGVSDFALSEQLANTYRRLVTTTPFLQQVADSNQTPLSASQLKGMIFAETSNNPPVVEIGVRSGDPLLAAQTADLIALEFIDYVIEQRLGEIARLQSAAAAQGIFNVQELVAAQFSAIDSLSLLEPVTQPTSPVLPKTRQNIIVGVLFGLMLATGAAFLLESLGDNVRSPEELNRRFGVTALGTIFRWSSQDADERELVLWKSPTSTYAESFRQIRANLQFATASSPGNVFLLCSPGPGEGKSTITCNIAIALAQMGKRVVVIDGDLRRATIHKRFAQVKREPGLSNFLAEFTNDKSEVIHATEIEGVFVIPSGPTPPNPAELLGSAKMGALLKQLRQEFDYVLVDSPPVLLVADGSILAAQANGAVIVVDGTNTRSSSLQATLNTLRNTKVNILGVIINKLKRKRFGYGYGYPYYYYYSYNGYYGAQENGTNGHKPLLQRPLVWARSLFSRQEKGVED